MLGNLGLKLPAQKPTPYARLIECGKNGHISFQASFWVRAETEYA
jgi:hypothetical protein